MKNILEEHLKENLRKYIFLLGLLLVGVLVGVIVVNNTENSQKEEINAYILEFINNIKSNDTINYLKILKESLGKNIKLIILIIAISFSIWGEVGNSLIVIYRGFSIGYSIASIISALGIGKGILFASTLLFISQLISIPAIMYIIVSCMNTYKKVITKEYEEAKYIIIRDSICVFSAIVLVLISSLIYTYLCINLFLLFTNVY